MFITKINLLMKGLRTQSQPHYLIDFGVIKIKILIIFSCKYRYLDTEQQPSLSIWLLLGIYLLLSIVILS